MASVRARLISVFNTDEKLPAVGAGKNIIKQPNISGSYMRYARWTWGNTYTHVYLGHDDVHPAATAIALRVCAS